MYERSFARLQVWGGAAVAVVGAVVLFVGWFGGVDILTRLHADLVSMKANTAIGFILGGTSVATAGHTRHRAVSGIAAGLLVTLGALTAIEYWFGVDLGIDELVIADSTTVGTSSPGRMGLNTALCFVMIGGGRLADLSPLRAGATIQQILVGATAFVAHLAFAGYIVRATSARGLGSATEMALHTSLAFLALCAAMLGPLTSEGILRVFHSPYAGGNALRRLLVPVVGLLAVTDGAGLVLENVGVLDSPELARAYAATVGVAVVVGALVVVGLRLDRADRAAKEVEARSREVLEAANVALEQRVQERTAQLRAANDELERSNRELTEFAYVASHDLREPLRMVSSFVRKIEERYDDQLDDRGRQYIGFAAEGADRMQSMIESILHYSQVGQTELQLRPLPLGSVLETVRRDLDARLASSRAEIVVDELPEVVGDETLLVQAFTNLVANAVKFVAEGTRPRVHVHAACEGEWVEVMVDDNGIGIEEGFRDEVFAIFRRLHTRADYSGTGIGLAVVHRVVNRHQGTVSIAGSPLGGTRVLIRLPAAGPLP